MASRNFWSKLFVIITFFLHLAELTDAIHATEWPISTSQFENTDVDFFCEVREKGSSEHLVFFTDKDQTDQLVTVVFANETRILVEVNNTGSEHSIKYEPLADGVYRLTYSIRGVKLADEGVYACGFLPFPFPSSISLNNILGEYATSPGATLEVLVPPTDSHPKCDFTTTDSLPLSVGSSVAFSCEISGGKPVPELTWHRNDNFISTASAQTHTLTLLLGADDNGVEFTCIASGTALPEEVSCSVTPLHISPSASITSSSSLTTSGSNASFSCIGEGIPMVSGIEWFINGLSVDQIEDLEFEIYDNFTEASRSSSELNIFNINLDRKNNMIDCVVKIPSGLSSKASVNLLHQRDKNGNNSGLLDIPLLPIVAGVSGVLVVLLVVFILMFSCVCKCSAKDGDVEGIYQSGEPIDAHAHTNAYQESAVDNDFAHVPDYVINELPGGQTSATMRSEHPYATIQRDAYVPYSP